MLQTDSKTKKYIYIREKKLMFAFGFILRKKKKKNNIDFN